MKLILALALTAACVLPRGVSALPSKVSAQDPSIKDAYKQLRLLNASTEAGVSYSSFGEEWRKALGPINIALEDSKQGKLTKQLEVIKGIYSDISNIWGCRFTARYISVALNRCVNSDFNERNPAYVVVLNNELSKNRFEEMEYPTQAIVSNLFAQGSAQVKELGKMLK